MHTRTPCLPAASLCLSLLQTPSSSGPEATPWCVHIPGSHPVPRMELALMIPVGLMGRVWSRKGEGPGVAAICSEQPRLQVGGQDSGWSGRFQGPGAAWCDSVVLHSDSAISLIRLTPASMQSPSTHPFSKCLSSPCSRPLGSSAVGRQWWESHQAP